MMLAAASVNLKYLAILLVPSLIALLMVALTWRARAKHQRESQAKPARAPGSKPGATSSVKSRSSASAEEAERQVSERAAATGRRG